MLKSATIRTRFGLQNVSLQDVRKFSKTRTIHQIKIDARGTVLVEYGRGEKAKVMFSHRAAALVFVRHFRLGYGALLKVNGKAEGLVSHNNKALSLGTDNVVGAFRSYLNKTDWAP